MDLYSIVGSQKPEVSFASGEVHATSFAGGPHVGGRNGGDNGHHYVTSRVHHPPIQLPPPPPTVVPGKSSIINVILGVSSCKLFIIERPPLKPASCAGLEGTCNPCNGVSIVLPRIDPASLYAHYSFQSIP